MGCFSSYLKNMGYVYFLFLVFYSNGCVTRVVDENGNELQKGSNQAQVEEAQKAIVVRYLNSSQPNKAYNELKSLFQAYGDDNVSLNNLMGLTQLSLGNFDKALNYFNKSYDKVPNPATGLNISSTYLAQGENLKAIKLIKELRKKFPDYSYYERYYHNLGTAYEGLGKNTIAIKYYKKALEENPNNYPSSLNIARLYKKVGKNEEAVEYYKTSSSLCELCLEPQREVSNYYLEEGNYRKAVSVLEEYLGKQDLPYEDRLEAKNILNTIRKSKNLKNKSSM